MNPGAGFWTPERVDELRHLHAVGYSHEEIAAKMGITKQAVGGKLARLNLRKAANEALALA